MSKGQQPTELPGFNTIIEENLTDQEAKNTKTLFLIITNIS